MKLKLYFISFFCILGALFFTEEANAARSINWNMDVVEKYGLQLPDYANDLDTLFSATGHDFVRNDDINKFEILSNQKFEFDGSGELVNSMKIKIIGDKDTVPGENVYDGVAWRAFINSLQYEYKTVANIHYDNGEYPVGELQVNGVTSDPNEHSITFYNNTDKVYLGGILQLSIPLMLKNVPYYTDHTTTIQFLLNDEIALEVTYDFTVVPRYQAVNFKFEVIDPSEDLEIPETLNFVYGTKMVNETGYITSNTIGTQHPLHGQKFLPYYTEHNVSVPVYKADTNQPYQRSMTYDLNTDTVPELGINLSDNEALNPDGTNNFLIPGTLMMFNNFERFIPEYYELVGYNTKFVRNTNLDFSTPITDDLIPTFKSTSYKKLPTGWGGTYDPATDPSAVQNGMTSLSYSVMTDHAGINGGRRSQSDYFYVFYLKPKIPATGPAFYSWKTKVNDIGSYIRTE